MIDIENLLKAGFSDEVHRGAKIPDDAQMVEFREGLDLAYVKAGLDPKDENASSVGVTEEDGSFQAGLRFVSSGKFTIHLLVRDPSNTQLVEAEVNKRNTKDAKQSVSCEVMASSDGGKTKQEAVLYTATWGLFIDFVMERAEQGLFVPVATERILLPNHSS